MQNGKVLTFILAVGIVHDCSAVVEAICVKWQGPGRP
jgi:hypothetical protein